MQSCYRAAVDHVAELVQGVHSHNLAGADTRLAAIFGQNYTHPHLEAFADWLSKRREQVAAASKKAKTVNRSVSSKSHLDASKFPECGPLARLEDCAFSMPVTMWLQQKWVNEDVLANNHEGWFGKSVVTQRGQFWKLLVKSTGFSHTRAAKYCESHVDKPDRKLLRQCIRDNATSAALNATAAINMMDAYWGRKDDFLFYYQLVRRDFPDRRTFSLYPTQGMLRRRLDRQLSTLQGFEMKAAETYCASTGTPPTRADILARTVRELTSACNASTGCKELPGQFCPEGTACDCQRVSTPQKALAAFNLVFFGVSPAAAAIVGGAAGFVSTGPAGVVAGAAAAMAAWPDMAPAVAAMALFSQTLFPKCMCFQLDCKYDEVQDACVMGESAGSQKSSSNPLAWLPPSGLKCVHSTPSSCQLLTCEVGDLAVKEPSLAGDRMVFGRAGYSYRKTDLYNCASIDGTPKTRLESLVTIPGLAVDGEDIPNSPQARVKVLSRYNIRKNGFSIDVDNTDSKNDGGDDDPTDDASSGGSDDDSSNSDNDDNYSPTAAGAETAIATPATTKTTTATDDLSNAADE